MKRVTSIISFVAVLALIVTTVSVAGASGGKGSKLEGVVNINMASAEELTMLPGIGPSKAAAIVSYRELNQFTTVDDINKVKGIGEKLFSNIQPYITVDGATTAKLVKGVSLELDTPAVGAEG